MAWLYYKTLGLSWIEPSKHPNSINWRSSPNSLELVELSSFLWSTSFPTPRIAKMNSLMELYHNYPPLPLIIQKETSHFYSPPSLTLTIRSHHRPCSLACGPGELTLDARAPLFSRRRCPSPDVPSPPRWTSPAPPEATRLRQTLSLLFKGK